MTRYDKEKDLARILVEGTKAVYGPEISARLETELERQRKLPVYRRNAEELTATVDRVFDRDIAEASVVESTIVEAKEVESIDDVVYQSKPSMITVAAKGTLKLVNKTCWYYPILGMLPGRIQEKLAKKYGHDANYYTISNMVAELVGASVAGYYIDGSRGVVLFGMYSIVHSVVRLMVADLIRMNESKSVSIYPSAPIYTALPFYATLGSILAAKAVPKAIISAGQKIKETYVSAYQQEQQELIKTRTVGKRIEEQPVKVRIEPQPEIVEEEFEDGREEEPIGINDKSAIVNRDMVGRDVAKKN